MGEEVEGVEAVFASGFDVAADGGEGLNAVGGSPAVADLLGNLGHTEISFGLVVIEGDGEVRV